MNFLSGYMTARKFAEAVRSHWGMENSLHWQLDAADKKVSATRFDPFSLQNGKHSTQQLTRKGT